MAKKVLYKVAFHGGFKNIWSSLMTIPEVDYLTIPNTLTCLVPDDDDRGKLSP